LYFFNCKKRGEQTWRWGGEIQVMGGKNMGEKMEEDEGKNG
jgi:hypothetical protein